MKTGPPPKKKKMKNSCFARCVPPNFDVADSDLKVPGAQFEIEKIVFFKSVLEAPAAPPPPAVILPR